MKSIFDEIRDELKKNDGVVGEDFVPSSARKALEFFVDGDDLSSGEETFSGNELSNGNGQSSDEEPITWAPGAMDGVILYHTQMEEPSAEEIESIGKAIDCLAKKGENEYLDEVSKIGTPTISIVGNIYDYIIEHKDEYDIDVMMSRAFNVMLGAFDLEAIKFALVISSMADFSMNESAVNIVRVLARYEEFTVFCIYNYLEWQEGKEEAILEAAKTTRGWGRIHAVSCLDMLRRDMGMELSNETKNWVFKHGINNGGLSSYSAEPSFMIAECEKKIEKNLSEEDMGYLADIVSALYEEPQFGIETITVKKGNRGNLVKKMLYKAKEFMGNTDEEDSQDENSTVFKVLRMLEKVEAYHADYEITDEEYIPEDMVVFTNAMSREILAICKEIKDDAGFYTTGIKSF